MQHAGLVLGLHAMLGQQRVDRPLVGIGDVCENDVLVRREVKFDVAHLLGDLPQGGLETVIVGVLHAAGFDEQGQEPPPVGLPMPAVKVARGRETIGSWRRKFDSGAFFNFGARPVHATLSNDIF